MSPSKREVLNKTFEEDNEEESKNHLSFNLSNQKQSILNHSSQSINKKSHNKHLRHDNKFHDTQGLFTDESESIQHDEDESMGR